MFTLDELRQKYKFKIKFLNYLTVKKFILKYIENTKQENIIQVAMSYIPLHIKPFFLHLGKVTKNLWK